MITRLACCILILVIVPLAGCDASQYFIVASKHFNESYLLAEIMSQLLEDRGISVDRRFGLGGTMICYQALERGKVDLYPEYSGTLEQAILKLDTRPTFRQLQKILNSGHGLDLLESFGFNNTYALAVRRETAEKHQLQNVEDLQALPALRFAFSYEFLNRKDGWPMLSKAYGLRQTPVGIEHGLTYQAIHENRVDVIDAWTTDAEIQRYDLVLLHDNLDFFPVYMAAPLLRTDSRAGIREILSELVNRIDEARMQRLNEAVSIHKKPFAEVARDFLAQEGLTDQGAEALSRQPWHLLAKRTVTHIKLTALAVLGAMVIAIPAGMLIYRVPAVSRPILYTAGLLQTIPSIALLAFMLPLFGIGVRPAIAALFLYALLPILRNTYAALQSLDPVMKKVAVGMGLTSRQRLRYIEIPLAMPTILTGVRTATVINIGTATLAAFIGAGGLGEPIVTGLALNDTRLILQGAVPAACLAILAELLFEFLERLLIPKHLAQTKY